MGGMMSLEGAGGAVQGGLDMWVWGSGARSGLEMGVQALSALKQSLRPQEAGGPRLGGERERERESMASRRGTEEGVGTEHQGTETGGMQTAQNRG